MTDISDKPSDVVKLGDHVIIQRKSYMKIHKVTSKEMVNLGNDKIQVSDILGKPLWTTFKLEPIPKSRRTFRLVECTDLAELPDDFIVDSGSDNRDIVDDGSSQKLSKEEIIDLRDSGCSSQEILGQLVENSTTFMNKTEYSQEKYLKKKEEKYFDFIVIRPPTVRLIFDILYQLDPTKLLGLRMDSLSQLTTAVDMHSDGTYLLYESGCQGVAAAAMMNCIAEGGNLIHTHPGNVPQKQAILAMNFDEAQSERLLSVNIYSLLRKLQPEEETVSNVEQELKTVGESEKNGCEAIIHIEPSELDNESLKTERMLEDVADENSKKRKLLDSQEAPVPKKPRWELTTEKAADILRTRKVDGLVIVAKEHPINIVKALLPFLGLSMPFVVFSLYREPLQELYFHMKAGYKVTALHLTETWLRAHQVLPNRTHPDVTMSGGGGYILTGVTVEA